MHDHLEKDLIKNTTLQPRNTALDMIWGETSKNATADTITNGPKYVELLNNKLLLHMTVHSTTVFMQDGICATDPKL